jgi:hypothetical protein
MSKTNDNRPDYELAREELRALVASLKLDAVVSPASGAVDNEKGQDGKPRAWVHLLYTITVRGEVFSYRMGEGHVPWDKVNARDYSILINGKKALGLTLDQRNMVQRKKAQPGIHWAAHMLDAWAATCAAIANAAGVAPDVGEVLGCVARDGEAVHMSFDDWCGEFGYDSDSRKAEETYNQCVKEGRKLRRFMTPAQIEKLSELSARL